MNVNAAVFHGTGSQDASLSEDDEAVTTRLKELYPSWNRKHLLQAWLGSGRRWANTIEEINLLESEIGSMPRVQVPARASSLAPTPQWKPSVAASEFPALGSEAEAPSTGAGTSWAQRATKNLGAPPVAPRLARLPPGFNVSNESQRGALPTREVWESGERIQQYSTGSSVSLEYADSRSDARDMALARNTLFEEATRAFQRGDKALAKQLAARGRVYNERMHEAHSVAAQSIFEARNAQSGAPGGRRIVDLHGLHVREAVSKLMEILDTCKRQGGNQSEIDVVVGTGKHSATNKGVLRREVIAAIDNAGYRWMENYHGLITVHVT